MKLPLFHALQFAVYSMRPQKMRYTTVGVMEAHRPTHRDTEVEVTAKMAAFTTIAAEKMAEDRHAALFHAKRMAAERLARELYGLVERELVVVLHMLLDEGLPGDHEACQKLNELIRALRGEDVA